MRTLSVVAELLVATVNNKGQWHKKAYRCSGWL